MKFKRLSDRVKYLKEEEGGVDTVCAVMQKYMDESEAKGKAEGMFEGVIKGTIETMIDLNSPETRIIDKIMEKFNLSKEDAEGYLSRYA